MTLYIVLGLIFVVACAAYFIFRRPPNRLVADVVNMPAKDRALILIQATVQRLKFDADNPAYSSIYLDPWSFPNDICEKLFSDLLDASALIGQNQHRLNESLREWGSDESLPQDELFAVRVWGVTIGGRLGKIKTDDVAALWKSLSESKQFIREALKDLQQRQQARQALGQSGAFLGDFSVQHVLQEANRVPSLGRAGQAT